MVRKRLENKWDGVLVSFSPLILKTIYFWGIFPGFFRGLLQQVVAPMVESSDAEYVLQVLEDPAKGSISFHGRNTFFSFFMQEFCRFSFADPVC